jgi:cytidylate kinase
MAVITISRQHGSGGREIAARVCDILQYHYFDKRLMAEAMAEQHVTEADITDYHEDAYKLRGFLDRLLGYRRPTTIADVGFWDKRPEAVKEVEVAALEEHLAVWLVQAAIKSAYERGNIVIVGRGGQVVLADRPGVLHVRIEAPLEVRVRRVAERDRLSLKEAQEVVINRDKASAEYLKRFYGVDWSDPLLYHLVINSGKWDIEAAARCIASAVSCLPAHPGQRQ